MLGNFVSLNSWATPGTILQAETPDAEIHGEAGDWPRLEAWIARRQVAGAGRGARAEGEGGAAIGYITYEGAFRFAWFPEITQLEAWSSHWAWTRRRDRFPTGAEEGSGSPAPWIAEQTRAGFEARVARAQEYIAAGEIYQVNLAQNFRTRAPGNPYRLFEHLVARSPAPGAAFLDFGSTQILSASPELFIQICGREITTCPIKGTRPRDPDPVRDRQLARELESDPKERAELVMITDLERNDLGQVCEYGSVRVSRLAERQSFAQVFHLASTVTGRLRREVTAAAAVRACLPGGSISGAPKKRAGEIIRELEPSPRGIYTGLLGYFDAQGGAAFNIAIRTLVQEGEHLHFSVGAGITAASVPAREYEETLHKAVGLQLALASYRAASAFPQAAETAAAGG